MQLLGDPLAVLEQGQALQLALERPYSIATTACSARSPPGGWRPLGAAAPPWRWPPSGCRGWCRARPGDEHRRPDPARTIGWTTRSSAEASASTTALPVRMTSPVTEALGREHRPQAARPAAPSAASTVSRPEPAGRAGWPGRHRPAPGVADDQRQQLPVPVPARMAVVIARIASRRWARSRASSYSWAFSIATPAWAASRVRAARRRRRSPPRPASRSGKVAVDPATGGDRSAEEGMHRRVVGWEPDRARILGDVVQPYRPGRRSAPRGCPGRPGCGRWLPLLGGHPGGEELADGAVAAQHPKPRSGPR